MTTGILRRVLGGQNPAPRRRQVVIAVTTAILLAAVFAARYPDRPGTALGLVLVAFLVPLTVIDLATRRLPDRLVLPAGLVALVLGTSLDPGGELGRLVAAAIAGSCFLLIVLAYPSGMGLGDVKLIAVLGLFLGAAVAVAIFAALIGGVIVGLAIIRRKGVAAGRKTAIPFGPFLAGGAVLAILAGPAILHAYLRGF